MSYSTSMTALRNLQDNSCLQYLSELLPCFSYNKNSHAHKMKLLLFIFDITFKINIDCTKDFQGMMIH